MGVEYSAAIVRNILAATAVNGPAAVEDWKFICPGGPVGPAIPIGPLGPWKPKNNIVNQKMQKITKMNKTYLEFLCYQSDR